MVKFLLPLFALALLLMGCTPTTTTTDSYGTGAALSSAKTSAPSPSSMAAKPSDHKIPAFDGKLLTGKHTVTLKTSKGNIVLELDADIAPKTVTNFVTLAESGFYDNLIFHRVIPGFMIQGGDPTGTGRGGESIFGPTFEDEINEDSPLYMSGYLTGVVAMANRGPNTNGSQFFIMDDSKGLAPAYTIFGHVTAGQDVVHAIATVDRDGNDRPLKPVTFSAEVTTKL
jgi:cyclophilin family peptidyl-prolyl cis-trans isomerase